MPESFIPVWMSIGEAEEFRRFLQEEARSAEGEFPEREFELIDSALENERPRSYVAMEAERAACRGICTTCGGVGTVEHGPPGATFSVPCKACDGKQAPSEETD